MSWWFAVFNIQLYTYSRLTGESRYRLADARGFETLSRDQRTHEWAGESPNDPHEFLRKNTVQVLKPHMATGAKIYYNDLDGAVR